MALLLPLTGAAAAQAATVRDGFLSALYQLPAGNRPDVQIYDTGALTPADAIAQARAAGAACIVGPLTREDVAAVAALGSESVPVLALNYLPAEQRAPSGLYEYALSPENEARMVARRILADGHRHGFAMVPRGDWGNRVIDAFTHELTAGGGSLISQIQYDPAAHRYGDSCAACCGFPRVRRDISDCRACSAPNSTSEPRHRGDVDFVFIVPESATNARLIEPQLKFFYAGDIPSYSLSVAFEPDSTTDANRDIDGLIYPEMPSNSGGDVTIDTVRSSVEQAWGNRIAWRGGCSPLATMPRS